MRMNYYVVQKQWKILIRDLNATGGQVKIAKLTLYAETNRSHCSQYAGLVIHLLWAAKKLVFFGRL